MSSIPLADAPELAPAARLTLLVRAALALLVVAALVAAVFAARNPHSQTIVPLPRHADTIVVLDLSASIAADTYSRIAATLSSLAHTIATRNGIRRPAVVLVSDLDDDPSDLARLASIVLAYRRDGIPLRVVGLNPSAENAAFFQRLLGNSSSIVQAGTATPGPQPRNRTPLPWTFVLLAVGGALALGVHELWSARLEWEPAR